MKFNLDKKTKETLNKLLDDNELNLSVSDILSSLIGNRDITSKNEMEILKKNSTYSDKDLFLSRIIDYLDFDMSIEDNEEIFNNNISNIIYKVDMDKYLTNPFYLKFKDLSIKENDYELVMDKYKAYELFAYQDMDYFSNSFIEKNSIGYFQNDFKFLALNYRKRTWMSITPNEIETMEKAINEVKGSVTVFGLGLGYFAFMASNKPEVKEVIIIEKDKNIINLFNKHIFNKFDHPEKVKIIETDALKYINSPLKTDYAFVDLWHDPFDGLDLFLKFCKSQRKSSNCRYYDWLESSFYMLLRRLMFTLINEQLEGLDASNYLKAECINDEVINRYYQKTKNLTISSENDLLNLLSDKTLLDLALND